jgi:uncharacterized repeat protein (TIGR01451 family)
MHFTRTYLTFSLPRLLIFFIAFTAFKLIHAQGPEFDNNAGTWTFSFNDNLGISAVQNTVVDPFAGIAQLAPGANSGSHTSSIINPPATDQWISLCLDATFSANTNLTVDILNAADDTPITGFAGMDMGMADANGCFDISGITYSSFPAIKVRVNYTRGVTAPTVSEIVVSWSPQSLLLFEKNAPDEIFAGEQILYNIRVSANFVGTSDVIVWDELPSVANGKVVYETGDDYGQDDSPTLASIAGSSPTQFVISGGGFYVPNDTMIEGKNIAKNSIAWRFDTMFAGQSFSLTYILDSKNGTLDGTTFENQAFAALANGPEKQSEVKTTAVRSVSSYSISQKESVKGIARREESTGILAIGDTNYVEGGRLFQILIESNAGRGNTGLQTHYNSVMYADLNDLLPIIFRKPGGDLDIFLGVDAAFTDVPATVNGQTIPANSIYWDIGTLSGGNTFDRRFSVRADTGIVRSGPHTSKIVFVSDQTAPVVDSLNIVLLEDIRLVPVTAPGQTDPDSLAPPGFFTVSPTTSYETAFRARHFLTNNTATTLRNNIIIERIPDGVTFFSAWFSNFNNNLNGEVWYYKDSTGTFTNPDTALAFDWTDPANTPGIAWTQTPPIDYDAPDESIWVVGYIPVLTSRVVNTDFNLPSDAQLRYIAVVPSNSNLCTGEAIPNSVQSFTYGVTKVDGTTIDSAFNAVEPVFSIKKNYNVVVIPAQPQIKINTGRSSITGFTVTPGIVNVNIPINVDDQRRGQPVRNVEVTVQLAEMLANGVPTFPTILSVSGAPVSLLDQENGRIIFDVGTLFETTEDDTIRIQLRTPLGVADRSTYSVAVSAEGTQGDCPTVTSANSTLTGSVLSSPQIQIIKDQVVSLIEPGGQIDYLIRYRGIGTGPTTNTWVIDRLPFESSLFGSAKTPNGEEVWFTDKLPPNMPTNQISLINPVDFNDIQANFVQGLRDDKGTPNDFSDDEVTSPFGDQTTWIAVNLNDPTLGGSVPISAQFREVRFSVRNDADGTGPGTAGSPSGTSISNTIAVIADGVPQAIANEIRTIVNGSASLSVERSSSVEVIRGGELFDWYFDYYNNSDADNDSVSLVIDLPSGVSINSISNAWNDTSQANGLPSGAIDITANAVTTSVSNPDGSTQVTLDIASATGLVQLLSTEEGGRISINLTVNPGIPSGTILTAKIRGVAKNNTGATVVEDEDEISIFNPDLSISKLVDDDSPNDGDTLTYRLVFSNEGLVSAPNVVIEDQLPQGISYMPGSTQILSGTFTLGEPSIAGNTLTWSDLQTLSDAAGTVPAQSGSVSILYKAVISGVSGDSLANIVNISTSAGEDFNFPNADTQIVKIPFPDPRILKSGDVLIEPGANIAYRIDYNNLNNFDAEDVYIVESLPDWDNDGNTEVTYVSSVSPTGVTAYFSSANGAAPAFDPNSPTSNGWTTNPGALVNHIAYQVGTLEARSPTFRIQLVVSAVEPITDILPPASTRFVNNVSIFTSSVDDDLTNNTASHLTVTPGIDITLTKKGNIEGAFPGLRPGDEQVYTIRLTNTGTQPIYGVKVEDVLPQNFIPNTNNFTDFTSLEAFDEEGESVALLGPTGDPLEIAVTPAQVGTVAEGQKITWFLGSNANTTDPDNYRNVGLPVGAYVEFSFRGIISVNAQEFSVIKNRADAIYDAPVGNTTPEDFTDNNADSTDVSIYFPDLELNKQVFSGSTTFSGEETFTDVSDTLTYLLTYNNLGSAAADQVRIEEIIPVGTSYIDSSLTLPQGASVTFNPNASNPTSFTVDLGPLPAPANYDAGPTDTARTLYLAGVDTFRLADEQEISIGRFAVEPTAIGTPGNPVAAPLAPKPPIPPAPQPLIPPAPQPAAPAAVCPTIPPAPQPTIPTAP